MKKLLSKILLGATIISSTSLGFAAELDSNIIKLTPDKIQELKVHMENKDAVSMECIPATEAVKLDREQMDNILIEYDGENNTTAIQLIKLEEVK